MVAFLDLNGVELIGTDPEVVTTVLAATAGDLAEQELADWIRGHVPEP